MHLFASQQNSEMKGIEVTKAISYSIDGLCQKRQNEVDNFDSSGIASKIVLEFYPMNLRGSTLDPLAKYMASGHCGDVSSISRMAVP